MLERKPVVQNLPTRVTVKIADVRLLEIGSLDQVAAILKRYNSLTIPREHFEVFKWRLTTDTASWFVQVGDVGLVYLTEMVPGLAANLHVLFWDGSLGKDRVECIKTVIATAFDEFKLERVSAYVPVTNVPLRRVLSKIGFVLEGCTRRGQKLDGKFIDLIQFGMLREEQPPCIALTTSSAQG